MFSDLTNVTAQIEHAFFIILSMCVALFFLVTFLMVFFTFKYHRGKSKRATDVKENVALEITWTVVPTILVLAMFYYGWIGYRVMKSPPAGAMNIEVIGRMWSWLFQYENGKQSDALYVPLNRPVKLNLRSQDVIHSFFIPAFRIKEDVVPGLRNYLWFEPERLGTYEILCTEYCGLRHSYMMSKVVVLPQDQFDTWYKGKQLVPVAAAIPSGEKGEAAKGEAGMELFKLKGCNACHSIDGSRLVGPTFKGLYGSKVTVTTDGKERVVTADDEYIRRSIMKPNADIVVGYPAVMPSQEGLITDNEIQQIIEYLKVLK